MILTHFAAIKIHESKKIGALRAYIHSSGKGKFAPMTVRIWEIFPTFPGAKLLAPPHGFAEAAAGNGKHKYYAGNFAGKASLKMFSCNLQFMKKLFNQKGNGCYKFSKKSHECTKMPKKDGKNGVHFMAQCQVIADYKELVGTCADIPQSLELSCIIWRHRAAWQYTNLVTQMVPKPSPLRCGMFWIEPSQFEEFGRKGRSRNRT